MGFFSKLVDNELEVNFHMCHESTIISIENLKDQFLDRLCFHSEMTVVKERPVQSVPNVLSIFYVTNSMAENAGEEEVEKYFG